MGQKGVTRALEVLAKECATPRALGGLRADADADRRRDLSATRPRSTQKQGEVIPPSWHAAHRHDRPGMVVVEKHPTFEIHVDKLGLPAKDGRARRPISTACRADASPQRPARACAPAPDGQGGRRQSRSSR